ncbi:MAG: chemotaxis protein CheR, partial [Nitrospinae bacterium]|nr:chemotaxis protein CheR [Nitrospinota bacterium]
MPTTMTIPEETLERLAILLATVTGLSFPRTKWSDLARALTDLAADEGRDDPRAVAEETLRHPDDRLRVEEIASRLTVGETYFFRDARGYRL